MTLKEIHLLKKREIECEIDKILYKSLILFSESEGIVCKKCGVIQGKPHLG